MKIFTTIATIAGLIIGAQALAAPADTPAEIAPIVQTVTAPEHEIDFSRDDVTVIEPEVQEIRTAEEIIADPQPAEEYAPMPTAPAEEIVDPGSAIGPFYVLEPCEYDEIPAGDVPNCYWDASERGNGIGYDFIWWEGEVFYPEFGR